MGRWQIAGEAVLRLEPKWLRFRCSRNVLLERFRATAPGRDRTLSLRHLSCCRLPKSSLVGLWPFVHLAFLSCAFLLPALTQYDHLRGAQVCYGARGEHRRVTTPPLCALRARATPSAARNTDVPWVDGARPGEIQPLAHSRLLSICGANCTLTIGPPASCKARPCARLHTRCALSAVRAFEEPRIVLKGLASHH